MKIQTKLFKKCTILIVLFILVAVLIGSIQITYATEVNNISSIDQRELDFCRDILRDKVNQSFSISEYKLLYSLDNKDNYIAVYDEDLNYFAVYDRDAGIIMERYEGLNPYSDYFNFKCYYGGYGTYLYENENAMVDITSGVIYNKDSVISACENEAEDMRNRSIASSNFSSRQQIVNTQNNIELLSSGEHTGFDPDFELSMYTALIITNRNYIVSNRPYSGQYVYVDNLEGEDIAIGYQAFPRCNSNDDFCYDIIHPLALGGVQCGEIAATILLQYYERMQIENTVPDAIYDMRAEWLFSNSTYSQNRLVSQIIASTIHSYHDEVGGGSTYVSIKNAINDYFDNYNIEGLSASSSVLNANVKNTLDNGEPCLIFPGLTSVDILNGDGNSYYNESIFFGHAMFCYGYSLNSDGGLDELLCHVGWSNTSYYTGLTYVSASAVSGNVRLLH